MQKNNIIMKRDIKFSASVLSSIHHLQAILWLDDPFNECSIEQGQFEHKYSSVLSRQFQASSQQSAFRKHTCTSLYSWKLCLLQNLHININKRRITSWAFKWFSPLVDGSSSLLQTGLKPQILCSVANWPRNRLHISKGPNKLGTYF
jgi:hypothetical protein